MPLLDHFHEPLSPRHPWESFHTVWAVTIMEQLNAILPRRFFAVVQTHLGNHVEADVAEFEDLSDAAVEDNGSEGGVVVQTYAPPIATHIIPGVVSDIVEVHVRDERRDARLVAVVELVSPRNKDRSQSREAFAAKCASYLLSGIGLVIADTVSSYHNNLHNTLMHLMELQEPYTMADEQFLYAAAYRPVHRQQQNQIDVWLEELNIDGSLPTLPLSLRGAGMVPLDLEKAYTDARKRSRL